MESENEQKLIFSGKTVEQALENAREKLGLDQYAQLSYKVIEEEPKKRFLLFGGNNKKDVKVQIFFNKNSHNDDPADDDIKQIVENVWKTNKTENRHLNEGPQKRAHAGGARPRHQKKRTRDRGNYRSNHHSEDQSYEPQISAPITPVSDEVIKHVETHMNALFQKMGMDITVTAELSVKNPGIIRVNPQGSDRAWLYGRKEDNIRSVEEMILKMIKTQYGEEQNCRLYFVGRRYRGGAKGRRASNPNRDSELTNLVLESIQKVKETGDEVAIGPFNSYERRLIHQCVSRESGMLSKSTGEGATKMVVIQKNNPHT